MSITRNDIEAVRDVAVACALTTDYIRLHLDRSGQDRIPLDHPLISDALKDIHRVQQRLSALDPDLTAAVLHLLRVANPYNDKQPEFFGRKFPTFHELAMAIPNLGSIALAGMLQKIAANKPCPVNILGLMDWQRSQPEEGDFCADKVVPAIEQEASAALQYLAKHLSDVHPQTCSSNSTPQGQLPAKPGRDPEQESRDKWIYQQWCNGMPWEQIKKELAKLPFLNRRFGSLGGIRRAAERYAECHALPIPPKRRPGRPATSK